MTDIGGNTALTGAAQGAAAVASGGLSIPAQLGIQAAVLVGATLLSRHFDKKAVLQKRRRIPDPASVEWNKNPIARHPTGDWVIDGGTVMAAFHKTSKDGSVVSDRCDVVIALANFDLPEPRLRQPVIRTADADPHTVLERREEGILTFFNGRPFRMTKEVESGKSLGEEVLDDNDELLYRVRHHYEPWSDTVHAGAVRAYWNRASDPDNVRWAELRAYMLEEPLWWEDKRDDPYTKSEYFRAWDDTHQLKGVSGIHLILNYTSDGIAGRVRNSDSKKASQITSFPTVSFEYQTGKSGNPADVLEYLVSNLWGFPPSIINEEVQAAARQRCEGYQTTLSGGRGRSDIKLKPMRVAGILTEDEPPLRLLQMLETVCGGQVAFRDNKVGLVAGEYKTNTPASRHLTESDLWRAPQVVTNIANRERRNAVQGILEVCLQSAGNSPVELPLVTNHHLRANDNNQFIERVPRIAYVNDWFDAQQLMAIHNELQGARRRVVLPIRDEQGRRQWQEGTDIVLNMPSIGIVGRTFIIDETELEIGEGLLISAYEQGDEDPFEWLDYADFDQNPDDEVLDDIETGEILVPRVSNVRRPGRSSRFDTEQIAFDLARIDKDYNYYLEVEYQTTGDWKLFSIFEKNLLTYQFEHLDFNNQTVKLRMRWRTASTRDSGIHGEWTEEFVSAPAVEAPPVVSGLSVASIQDDSALAVWYAAEYLGHKRVELRHGTGTKVGTNVVGEVVELTGPVYSHPLTGLAEKTDYWVQVRFVNENDVAIPWADAASAMFRTGTKAADRITQYAYLPGQESEPAIPAQTDAQKTNPNFLPAGAVPSTSAIPEPTQTNPVTWLIIRVHSTDASRATDWAAHAPAKRMPSSVTINNYAIAPEDEDEVIDPDPGPVLNLAVVDADTTDQDLAIDWDFPDTGGSVGGFEIRYRKIP